MASVEIVRSFAVASFPNATVVLNLSTGTFFQLEAESAQAVLDIARELPSAEIEERMAQQRKIPRYVARERVRALQLQLASPFTLASTPRLGQSSFVDVAGHVNIGQEPGVLRAGESVQWSGSTVLLPGESITFVGGRQNSGRAILCAALHKLSFEVLAEEVTELTVQKGQLVTKLTQAWFLEPQSRAGMGLILARRGPVFAFLNMLSYTQSVHARGAWVELFKMYASLAESLPAFRVTLPDGDHAVRTAVADFTGQA